MEDKLSIKVNIAERFYPLKIDRADEEKIRKAARLINEKVLQYKQRYVDKDTQDFVAMAALQFVIQNIELENKSSESPFEESLKELNDEIKSFLEKE
ncbi:MAG: cell division protein ZapA [Bacteroidales bacterium]|nr:cell division protein ZapA [Bacteroidales bacterium]